jgi:hypothetical protein
MEGRDNSEDLDTDIRIILRWIFNRLWVVFMWLRRGTGCGPLNLLVPQGREFVEKLNHCCISMKNSAPSVQLVVNRAAFLLTGWRRRLNQTVTVRHACSFNKRMRYVCLINMSFRKIVLLPYSRESLSLQAYPLMNQTVLLMV